MLLKEYMSRKAYQEFVDDCGASPILYRLLVNCKCTAYDNKINATSIPITRKPMIAESVDWFNQVYQTIVNQGSYWHKIVRTPSGGISVKRNNFLPPMYDVTHTVSTVCLTIVSELGCYRIIIGSSPKENDDITGREAYNRLKNEFKIDNIDIESYAIENGKDVKDKIVKPYIKLADPRIAGKTYYNAHHIDINSSFLAGVACAHPELRPTIERIYDNRKSGSEYQNKLYKAILTHSYGFFQSKFLRINNHPYALAQFAKEALDFNNAVIDDLALKLELSGRQVLAYNTDGIWYIGDIYTDNNTGTKLGQYKNDHTNCTIRFKSAGAYEYVENDTYNVTVRGQTLLDRVIPRDEWHWGDIFRDCAEVIKFVWSDTLGILKQE